jgi:hypothetical protein
LPNPSIEQTISSFPSQFFLFFTVLFTGKVKFGGENPILQALGTQFLRFAIA